MHRATFRFYAELGDFLPPSRRQRSFTHAFWGTPSIKEVIEALGIPHTEVDLILINEQSVGFETHLKGGDHVAVYPVFESLDIESVIRLRPSPLRQIRFVSDIHVAKLARYLRLLGFDATVEKEDAKIISDALSEKRIILTRDLGILKQKAVTHGYFLRETSPKKQLIEVVKRFDLLGKLDPFSRCLECNTHLKSVSKETIQDRLPPKTQDYYESFMRCPTCERLYWEGSHYAKLTRFIEEVVASLERSRS